MALPTGIVPGAFIPPPEIGTPSGFSSGFDMTPEVAEALRAQAASGGAALFNTGGTQGVGSVGEAGVFSGIDFGSTPNQVANARTIDDIIRQTKPVAEDILRSGTESALAFSRQAQAGVEDSLSQFLRPEALGEQAALLGARGGNAQRRAIAAIPVSAAQQEADRRETVGLQRRAAAGGELGAGSTLLASGQLAGQQQANRIGGRVEQLEQLAGIDRQLIGDISRNRESEMARRSALQAGLGGQIANVGLGLSGAAVESIQTQAEISGLRGIASANRSAQNASSIANLAGQVFTPSNISAVGNFFNQPPPPVAPLTQTQNLNFNQMGA